MPRGGRRQRQLWWYAGVGIVAVGAAAILYRRWKESQEREREERGDANDNNHARRVQGSVRRESIHDLSRAMYARKPRKWTLAVALNNTFFDHGDIVQVSHASQLSVRPGVDPKCLARLATFTDLYVMVTVADDDSEKACREFLANIAPNDATFDTRKVICTQTIRGRASVARHIDPDVVVECDAGNVWEHTRFIDHIVLVRNSGLRIDSSHNKGSERVVVIKSLHHLLVDNEFEEAQQAGEVTLSRNDLGTSLNQSIDQSFIVDDSST